MQTQYLILVISFFHILLCVFGFVTFNFNRSSDSYQNSRFQLIYSAIVLFLFSHFFLKMSLELISTLNPFIANSYCYVTLFTIDGLYVIQLCYRNRIVKFVNDSRKIFNHLDRLVIVKNVRYYPYLLHFLGKVLLTNTLVHYALWGTLLILMTDNSSIVSIILVSIGFLFQSIPVNTFYACILVIGFYYKQINQNVSDIL